MKPIDAKVSKGYILSTTQIPAGATHWLVNIYEFGVQLLIRHNIKVVADPNVTSIDLQKEIREKLDQKMSYVFQLTFVDGTVSFGSIPASDWVIADSSEVEPAPASAGSPTASAPGFWKKHMKKIIIATAVIVVVGAGCAINKLNKSKGGSVTPLGTNAPATKLGQTNGIPSKPATNSSATEDLRRLQKEKDDLQAMLDEDKLRTDALSAMLEKIKSRPAIAQPTSPSLELANSKTNIKANGTNIALFPTQGSPAVAVSGNGNNINAYFGNVYGGREETERKNKGLSKGMPSHASITNYMSVYEAIPKSNGPQTMLYTVEPGNGMMFITTPGLKMEIMNIEYSRNFEHNVWVEIGTPDKPMWIPVPERDEIKPSAWWVQSYKDTLKLEVRLTPRIE